MKRAQCWAYALLWPFFVFCAVESIVRGGAAPFFDWFRQESPWTLLVNGLMYFALFNLFQFVKRRPLFLFSQVCLTALFLLMAVVSHLKILWRLEPLLPGDVRYLNDILHIGQAYIPKLTPLIIGLALGFALFFAFIFVLFRKQKRRGEPCFSFLSLAIALAAGLYLLGEPADFREWVNAKAFDNRYSLVENASKNGSLFQALEYAADHRLTQSPPEGYSDEGILALAAMQTQAAPEETPNVVMILGESMADLSKLSELAFMADPLPNLHRFMAEGNGGTLKVGTYGGGTLLAESAMLTGLEIAPYVSRRVDAIPHRLKPLSYTCTAIHTYWGWFYDRNKDIKDLGFDLFLPLETLTSTPAFSPYPRDKALYDQLLNRLYATQGRDFIYAATMETHGGYDYAPLTEDVFVAAHLPKEAEQELNNYLVLQKRADEALAELISALEAFDEPTVVLYFGDHYPAIPHTLAALGIALSDPRLYETPCFVWANFPLTLDLSAATTAPKLAATVLNALHLPLTLAQELALKDGREADYALATYDALYGKRLAAHATGIRFDNQAYRIGLPPVLSSLSLTAQGELLLEGENLPWRAVLQTESASCTVVLNTDGRRATARLPEGFEKAALLQGGTVLFVDDNDKPFAACPFVWP